MGARGDHVVDQAWDQFFHDAPALGEQAVQVRALRYAAALESVVRQYVSFNDRDGAAGIRECGRGQEAGDACAEDNTVVSHIVHASPACRTERWG